MKSLKRESDQINNPLGNLRVVRVALFGARGVGKSAIAKQFVYNEFDPEEELSMVEVYQKQVIVNGEPLILEILDTGQDLNSPIVDQYFAGSDGYLLVFSIWDMDSLNVVSEARSRIRQARLRGDNFDDAFRIPMVLVGNKTDLPDDERLSSKVLEHAETFSVPLITTSAWTGEGIHEAFTTIITEVDKRNSTNAGRTGDERLRKLSKRSLLHTKCTII
ncbi:hypothetical protein FO519_000676 [Halicephalobus sp. NKZ332]|nr:hypothetical protein FO519_000676 [Halicephalobus sp. NKZ332]